MRMKGHEGIICVHVTLWKQNCVRPIKSNNKRNVRPFGRLGLNPQRRIIGIGTYYYTVLLSWLAPTVHCDRAHFDPDRSFLSATQNFRFSFFLIRGPAKRNTSSPPPPSYHTYNWNLMDYKHRFRFFCCPHCVRLTLCPFVHPLLCGTDCYKHGLSSVSVANAFTLPLPLTLHRRRHLLLLLLLLLMPTGGGPLCILCIR
ncbi:unnamed protein product [Aphis gossypii]|uniref:Uncharacterized protein n=1 Tax=Aphis gossypii TaxID=80765 RepID=A0A9P0IUL8_APHGO|nr:unnamed protein product [Aphis gossypii]